MERLKHNAERMMERRGPYEAFAVILTLALIVGGEWIAAALVGLVLVDRRHHRLVEGQGRLDEPVGDELGHRVGHADGDRGRPPGGPVLERGQQLLAEPEDALGVALHVASEVGELEVAAGAPEQRPSEAALELRRGERRRGGGDGDGGDDGLGEHDVSPLSDPACAAPRRADHPSVMAERWGLPLRTKCHLLPTDLFTDAQHKMAIDGWDEIRTAYHVARAGTVSGAAEALGVHHATVIRHVDALESRLGVKLFQRHARGYTATEAGQDLLQVAQATDDQFSQLVGRIRGRGEEVRGELVVTSLASVSPRLTPTLARFQDEHRDLIVRYLTDDRLFRLEYGEAHVAIRAGAPPEEPDNVVQPFLTQQIGLYGAAGYLERHPAPVSDADLDGHVFVGLDEPNLRAPFHRWMQRTIPPERVIFRASDQRVVRDAVIAGVGLGFVADWDAERFAELRPVLPPRDEWSAPLWLVTHVDLHRTAKVQTFVRFLKQEARSWN